MREDLRKYSDEAYSIVKYASEDIGSRLPGSDSERKFADHMGDKLKSIGITPVKEKFLVAPRSGIGGIPYAGWAGLILSVMMFFEQLYGLVAFLTVAVWLWVILCVFLYKPWFDFAFPQKPSQNVYGQLLPRSGKVDYTIMLSAHTDTSWNWKHSMAKHPTTAFVKMGFGIVAFLTLTVISWTAFGLKLAIMLAENAANLENALDIVIRIENLSTPLAGLQAAIMFLIPLFIIPGSFLLTMWADKDPANASPGAMDNATGVALCYEVMKYYKENPHLHPEGCRFIDLNVGSEEAGLKGAQAFVKRHKKDGMLDDCYNLNIDSIADMEHFNVVHGDAWLGTKFDGELADMLDDSMRESGISKPNRMKNPVGGCDSTPFRRAGVATITFAAQNPVITNYYHTFQDTADRFDGVVLNKGMEVILRVVDKINAKEIAEKKEKAMKEGLDKKKAQATAYQQAPEAPKVELTPEEIAAQQAAAAQANAARQEAARRAQQEAQYRAAQQQAQQQQQQAPKQTPPRPTPPPQGGQDGLSEYQKFMNKLK
jgi:hypothetical protein